MANLGGRHKQAGTGREVIYWAAYGPVSETEVFYSAVISEYCAGWVGGLGHFDGTVSIDPEGVPVDLAIRSQIMSRIDQSKYGEASKPGPEWIGWYGPYR